MVWAVGTWLFSMHNFPEVNVGKNNPDDLLIFGNLQHNNNHAEYKGVLVHGQVNTLKVDT